MLDGDESAPEFWRKRDTVDAKSIGYFSANHAGIHVPRLDLSSMRDVESAGRFIDDEIVPSTLSFDGIFLMM